jgi:DDE superfamily endonuclease/helix-turn-helix, Psq domain
MPRTYVPVGSKCNPSVLDAAVQAVLAGMSYRKAADVFGVNHCTIQYKINSINKPSSTSKYEIARVFTDIQEAALTEHILTAARIHHGLTIDNTRKLAYEYAVFCQRKVPNSWKVNEKAGIDWLQSFRKRHLSLSLRKPENTSLARAISFNRANVSMFFDNLMLLRTAYNYEADDIINLDETALSTVVASPKVLAPRGTKQVGQVVSGERGDTVTLCSIVTAAGRALPPVFVFPRVKFQTHFLNGAPPSSLGLAAKSGWMNSVIFLDVLKHIQKHKRCTTSQRLLLIMDNHESHISLAAINYCRDNGIDVLTLPPHCSHKMQPLDVNCFGPFKTHMTKLMQDQIKINPGKFARHTKLNS